MGEMGALMWVTFEVKWPGVLGASGVVPGSLNLP